MKVIKLSGLAFMIMIGAQFSSTVRTAPGISDSGGTPIIITQEHDQLLGPPRTSIPFFAEYSDDYVLLGASISCGTVAVRITSSAGDDYSTNFISSMGMILLPISGDSGQYLLSLTTSDGLRFVGRFTI